MKKVPTPLVPLPARRRTGLLMTTLRRCPLSPDDRQHKIASLTDTVQNHTYRIDCRKLADCLISGLLLGLL